MSDQITINFYFWIVLAVLLGFYLLDVLADLLNVRSSAQPLPPEFSDVYDEAEYRKSQLYVHDTTRFGLFSGGVSLLIVIGFWFAGGFYHVDQWIRGLGFGVVGTGLLYFGVLGVAQRIVSIPFSLYDTFVIEERFGFNKTTIGTFIADEAKSLLLTALLGGAVAAVVLLLFIHGGDAAWFYGWVAVAVLMIVFAYLAPPLILPLFYKLTPLPEGELRTAIFRYAEQVKFPLQDISVIDGSRRSTKSNAFFTGFGRNKQVALYDTLVEMQSTPELLAVLAHEVGHYKKKHIVQHLVWSLLQLGLLFYLASWFISSPELFAAFGVRELSVHAGLVFFFILYEPISRLLGVLQGLLSRRNEYQADRFAAETTGDVEPMVRALKQLSRDNLVNLTPHPLHVVLYHSHPPMIERIQALRLFQFNSSAADATPRHTG